jgi:hypothetical protein
VFLLAVVLAGNAFLSAFGGSWSCTPHIPGVVAAPRSRWTIAQAPKSSWIVVRWSARDANGTAFVGYLGHDQAWVYDDFHSDGSLTANTSPGPENGVWTWSGSLTSQQRLQHGAIQWRRDGAGFRQSFGRLIGPSFLESASATCLRVKS